jgi:hypothetical protein
MRRHDCFIGSWPLGLVNLLIFPRPDGTLISIISCSQMVWLLEKAWILVKQSRSCWGQNTLASYHSNTWSYVCRTCFPFTFVLSLHTCFVSLSRANLFTFYGTVSKYNYLFILLMISFQFVPHFWWKQSWFACRTDSLSEWPSESDMRLCCNDAPFCICITIGKLWCSIICCWSISFYLLYISAW